MPRNKQSVDSAFTNGQSKEDKMPRNSRKPSNAVVSESVNKENEMNTQIATSEFASAYENRRQFVARTRVPSLNLSKEMILTASPAEYFRWLFNTGKVRLTDHSRATRAEGTMVIFGNPVQMRQLGHAIANLENKIHSLIYFEAKSAIERQVAFMDLKGDASRMLVETIRPDHYVDYEVYYATVARDFDGKVSGIHIGGLNPMEQSILREVEGYNQWVNMHNAVAKVQVGAPLTNEELAAYNSVDEDRRQRELQKMEANDDPNLYVRNNSVRHILADSIVNKYAIEAAVALAQELPAFELYNPARSQETTIAMLEKLCGPKSAMEWGYQSQLAMLSNVELFPKAQ